MSEKDKNIIRAIISILSENKCTVADAKWLLDDVRRIIMAQTTVQGENVSLD